MKDANDAMIEVDPRVCTMSTQGESAYVGSWGKHTVDFPVKTRR